MTGKIRVGVRGKRFLRCDRGAPTKAEAPLFIEDEIEA